MWSVRRSFVLACLFVAVVAIGASGASALPWANEGCADWPGTRDADISVQIVPFGIVCTYEADATGPADVVVRAASIPAFAAWLVLVGAVVAYGIRRRERPAARGLVTGAGVLGVFGLLAMIIEFRDAFVITAVCGIVVVAVLEVWLWPSRVLTILTTALLVPIAVLAAWFFPGLSGWEEPAALLALVAAAGATVLGSQTRSTSPSTRFQPLT